MNMTSLQDISRKNNQAVIYMARGHLLDAFSLWESAMFDFYKRLETAPEVDEELPGFSSSGLESIRAVSIHSSLCAMDTDFSPDNSFPLYNRTFLLPVADLDRDEVAIALLYNFGLVLQKRGIAERRQKWLKNSFKIYAMAMTLLQDEALEDAALNQGIALLRLAVWANQGFLYSYNMEYENVIACKDWLHQVLLQSPPLELEDTIFFHRVVFWIQVFGLPKELSPAA